MPIELTSFEWTLLAIAVATALIVPFVATWRTRSGAHWGPALALGAGYFLYHQATAHPSFPPSDVTDRIAWLALPAMILGICESIWPGPGWTRWENRLIVIGLVLGAMLGPVMGASEDQRTDLIRLGVSASVMLLSWLSLEVLTERVELRALGPPLLVVIGGSAGLFLVSGSLVCAQLAGGMAALLGLVWIISWFRPEMRLSHGGVPVLVTVLTAILLNGQVYASTPLVSALLIAASPLAAWLGWVGPMRRLAGWQSALIAMGATLVPVAIAVGLAFGSSPSFTE
jgi:hypothetical protein